MSQSISHYSEMYIEYKADSDSIGLTGNRKKEGA